MDLVYEISKEELKDFEVKGYEGEIIIVEDRAEIAAVIDELRHEDFIGFDTESKPQFVKGKPNSMALLQFAGARSVYLIRVNKTGFPPELIRFFNRYPGEFVGIGLDDDWREIRKKGIDVQPKNPVDLNVLAKQKGFISIGAKKLCALLLGFTISKGQQTSNWETNELSDAQIKYAATDAWICRDLYLKISAL
ncbi:MAG: 3'-5' exonuclease [Luteibaculum sp.]